MLNAGEVEKNLLYIKEVLENHIMAESLVNPEYRWKFKREMNEVLPTLYAYSIKDKFIENSILIIFHEDKFSMKIDDRDFHVTSLEACEKNLNRYFEGKKL